MIGHLQEHGAVVVTTDVVDDLSAAAARSPLDSGRARSRLVFFSAPVRRGLLSGIDIEVAQRVRLRVWSRIAMTRTWWFIDESLAATQGA